MVAAQLGENNKICLATEKHASSRSNLSMSKNVRMVFSYVSLLVSCLAAGAFATLLNEESDHKPK